ncbi:bifunctional oligoribonuclease/PAP phosphatase NrnA [Chitinophaga pendula]|uniref:DHH family phosphoesterase n=1 Tax=Chitinophaga TaxID=79328 RepID=UPI000BB076AF|nr:MULTISPECIES: bifunctional oligoribonuclease/PAP phosphatase NrnA [Chitinophaga]ASZ12824.1 DHH family phosphoesterase [Chitinophaga sp. MD30]UCJ09549.1 bifunctional oligoribonuclease/PAP phosphatase NrnA [Chitinophaga pendula]
MKPIEEIKPLLEDPKKIVVTMHQKPDADAMGSSLALYHYLQQKGHEVTVISPTNFPDFLKWMPGAAQVVDFESMQEKALKSLEGVELLFCLDFNALYRTKNLAPYLEQVDGVKILIDHHLEPQPTFDYGVSDTTASSTAQLVYETLYRLGEERYITVDMASCIYAGTMTDTGSFRFASTTARVHRMVADLMDRGLKHEEVHQAIYDNFLENRLRFLGHALLNRMEVFYEYNTAMIAIPYSDLKRFDLQTGDTEGVVNFLLSIQGIKLAALIIDRNVEVKLSFRSKGNFDVNTFARKYFDGGGHFNASGGRSTDPLDVTVDRFVKAIEENETLLQ